MVSFFSRYCGPLAWAALAAVSSGSPAPLVVLPPSRALDDLALRRALDETIQTRHLERRMSADFGMDKTWQNEMLFSGYVHVYIGRWLHMYICTGTYRYLVCRYWYTYGI